MSSGRWVKNELVAYLVRWIASVDGKNGNGAVALYNPALISGVPESSNLLVCDIPFLYSINLKPLKL
jgi:hypothetical protein